MNLKQIQQEYILNHPIAVRTCENITNFYLVTFPYFIFNMPIDN